MWMPAEWSGEWSIYGYAEDHSRKRQKASAHLPEDPSVLWAEEMRADCMSGGRTSLGPGGTTYVLFSERLGIQGASYPNTAGPSEMVLQTIMDKKAITDVFIFGWRLPPKANKLRTSLISLVNRLVGAPYGWGGLYGNRECSATLQDLFRVFGLWLPRNSSDQAKAGQSIQLGGLSHAAKEELILRRGLPHLAKPEGLLINRVKRLVLLVEPKELAGLGPPVPSGN